MKKVLLLSLTVFMFFVIAACSDAEDVNDNNDDDNNDDTYVLNTDRTDELELTADYEGKSFITDGIGEVELSACVDGDTTRFTEAGSDSSFSVRYLGVDTPESTASIEPWGKAASEFVCEVLTNAETIVLEWDENAGARTTGDRWLAFVWYDGRLLNLELIELAFSASSAANLKYGDTMQNAWYAVQGSGLRIYGETDPDYDYSIDGSKITIEELITNRELYVGRRVVIEGTITIMRDDEFVLSQDGHTITVYYGYGLTGGLVEVGNTVEITDLVPTYFPAHKTTLSALQLSDFDRKNVTLIESATETE